MLLRFRTGKIVVQQMKEAIEDAQRMDRDFRSLEVYKEMNKPALIKAACDDEERKRLVEPLECPSSFSKESKQDTEHEGRRCMYEDPPGPGYQDLRWLAEGAGFDLGRACSVRSTFSSLGCPRRAVPSSNPWLEQESTDTGEVREVARTQYSTALPRHELDSESLLHERAVQATTWGKPCAEDCPTHLHPKQVTTSLGEGYSDAITSRHRADTMLQRRLTRIREKCCKPWDHCAQLLFRGGTVSLLLAACLLVTARWAFEQVSLPEGVEAFPSARLAAWGFCSPCAITVVVLIYVQVRRHPDEVTTKMPPRSGTRHLPPGHLPTVAETPSCNDEFDRSGYPHCEVDARGYHSSVVLCAYSVANLIIFTCVAEFGRTPQARSPHWGSNMSHASWGWDSNRTSYLSGLEPLSVTAVALAWGTSWPPFWEPSGATWWPNQRRLVITGGMGIIELDDVTVGFRSGRGAVISRFQKFPGLFQFADICIVPTAAGNGFYTPWLAAKDDHFSVIRADGSNVSTTILRAASLFPQPMLTNARLQPLVLQSSPPRALACSIMPSNITVASDPTYLLWLVENSKTLPYIVGVTVSMPDKRNGDQHLLQPRMAYQLHLDWLTSQAEFAHILRSSHNQHTSVTIESIEQVGFIRLLLLLTISELMDKQLLVVVGSSGRLQQWWAVPLPPSASSLGVSLVRWVAMAVDQAAQLVFLVSNGPQPCLSTAKLPIWQKS